MKPIWSGTIAFGLVSIPVHLHAAVEASERVSFRQLHRTDRAPIRYKKFCSKEDVEVPASEIVRGYQVARGKVGGGRERGSRERPGRNRQGLAQHRRPRLRAVRRPESPLVRSALFHDPRPGRGEGLRAATGCPAGEPARRHGVRFFFRTRPVLGALVPGPRVLALETLRTADELRDPAELKIPKAVAHPNEVKLAQSLIGQMSEDAWDPTVAPDVYEKALRKLLATRPTVEVAGDDHPKADQGKVVDLMEALRRSVGHPRRRGRARSGRREAK